MAMPLISFLSLALCLIFPSFHDRKANAWRRESGMFSCGTGNPSDDCWRCDDNWNEHRERLADCAIGFGKNAIGGRDGKFYTVTDGSDDDVVDPKPGTLRHAVIQDEPLWITFAESMSITLKEELIMNSFKTIDGRGVDVVLTGNSGITVQYVHNIIIHSITINGMKPAGNTHVPSSPEYLGWRNISDGDAISIFGSEDVWVDHCTLSDCADGLVDVVEGSTGITISNNYFHDHDKVMLLGHSDEYIGDRKMRVTVVFNVFGEGLGQRMPRCRHGTFEVINNHYPHGWGLYAIAGSANPIIISRGNVFVAPDDKYHKQVTYHGNEPESVWQHYTWSTRDDAMANGAYFTSSGSRDIETISMDYKSPNDVYSISRYAGVPSNNLKRFQPTTVSPPELSPSPAPAGRPDPYKL